MSKLHTIPDACQSLRLGRSKVFQLIRRGDLAVVRVGRSVRITERALSEFVARLERETHDTEPTAQSEPRRCVR